MSRQAGSIVRGCNAALEIRNGPAAGVGYLLRDQRKVKVLDRRRAEYSPRRGPSPRLTLYVSRGGQETVVPEKLDDKPENLRNAIVVVADTGQPEVNRPSLQTTPAPTKPFWSGLLLLAVLIVFPLLYLCSFIALGVCFGVLEHRFSIAAVPAVILTLSWAYCFHRYPAFQKATIAFFELLRMIVRAAPHH